MASLTARADGKKIQGDNNQLSSLSFKLTTAERFYQGGFYGLSAAGRLTELSDAAGVVPLGIISHFGEGAANDAGAIPDNVLGDTSLSPEPEAVVDVGRKVFRQVPVAGASTIANVGDDVYLTSDNWEADLTLTEAVFIRAIGKIIRFHSATSFDVMVFPAYGVGNIQGAVTKKHIGALNTSALEGTIASANVIVWSAPHAGIIRATTARPSGFDTTYSAGSVTLRFRTDKGIVSGGNIGLSSGNINAKADLASEISGTTVTNTSGNAEFSAGGTVRAYLVSGGTGFTAVSDTQAYDVRIEYLELPAP